eukprot:4558882-Prorocentrum_lima.AAC.1
MTSSLVGSEMCIRDRFDTILGLIEQRNLGRSMWTLPDLLKPLEKSGTAVSYTHLTLPTICSV